MGTSVAGCEGCCLRQDNLTTMYYRNKSLVSELHVSPGHACRWEAPSVRTVALAAVSKADEVRSSMERADQPQTSIVHCRWDPRRLVSRGPIVKAPAAGFGRGWAREEGKHDRDTVTGTGRVSLRRDPEQPIPRMAPRQELRGEGHPQARKRLGHPNPGVRRRRQGPGAVGRHDRLRHPQPTRVRGVGLRPGSHR